MVPHDAHASHPATIVVGMETADDEVDSAVSGRIFLFPIPLLSAGPWTRNRALLLIEPMKVDRLSRRNGVANVRETLCCTRRNDAAASALADSASSSTEVCPLKIQPIVTWFHTALTFHLIVIILVEIYEMT